MKRAGRVIAMILALSMTIGALAPLAHAQQPPAPPPLTQEQMRGDDDGILSNEARANVVNVFRVPGKGIVCVVGSTLAIAVLAASLGFLHQAANGVFDEGCSGKWVLTAADVQREREVSRAFDWETHRFDWEPR